MSCNQCKKYDYNTSFSSQGPLGIDKTSYVSTYKGATEFYDVIARNCLEFF